MSHGKRIIIAIHGAGMQAGVWTILAEKLSCSVEAFSLPGHGKTAGPLLASIEAMALWTGEQIKDRPPQSVILMGHSMGALVALEAARHPSVAGLVLMGAALQMPVHQDLLKQSIAAPDAAAALILKWGVSAAHADAATLLKNQMQPAALAKDLAACNAYKRGTETAKTVRHPALVLAGAEDKLTRADMAKALAETLPQALFHLVAGSGHMLMVEDPAVTAGEINIFTAAINS